MNWLHYSTTNKQITLNALPPTILTRPLLPILQQQPNAYTLNVSSLANFFHIPGKEVYSATKTFYIPFRYCYVVASMIAA